MAVTPSAIAWWMRPIRAVPPSVERRHVDPPQRPLVVEALGEQLARQLAQPRVVQRTAVAASATCQSRSGSASTQAGGAAAGSSTRWRSLGQGADALGDALAQARGVERASVRRRAPSSSTLPVWPLIAADSRRRIWASSKLRLGLDRLIAAEPAKRVSRRSAGYAIGETNQRS